MNVAAIKDQIQKKGETLSLEQLIRNSADQLKMALPEHMRPERIVRIALTTLKTNPELYKCDPYSFLGALFQAAQLGLEPNLNGEAWIIPYRTKGNLVAQFQVGAYGFVKLFWNHQNAVSLQVESVHKNDSFSYDLGTGEINHKPPVFGQDRGETIGYYAVGALKNGGRSVKVMSKQEAVEFGKKFSKCWDRNAGKFKQYTPWAEHFDEMAKKTVLKQLMKLLPKF
jgi:recombination protein RecT